MKVIFIQSKRSSFDSVIKNTLVITESDSDDWFGC